MNFLKKTAVLLIILMCSLVLFAQKKRLPGKKNVSKVDSVSILTIKNSPAYGELLLRKTELEAEYKEILSNYTEEHPDAKEKKFQIDSLVQEMRKIERLPLEQAEKLTSAVGKLMLRRAELNIQLNALLKQYTNEHPEVIKVQNKLKVFENEINSLLK